MHTTHRSAHTMVSVPVGVQDVYGVRMRRRQHALDTIRSVYESFGFEPLSTPVLEYGEVFHGHHGEGEKLLFHLNDQGGKSLVLRYDLTVPLARVVSVYQDIPCPYRRYQIATVFRDDEVDLGHFREFTQCDGDVIGEGSIGADADIISLACAGLSSLGFADFRIRVNHRGLLKGICEKADIPGQEQSLARALDFIDKELAENEQGNVESVLERYRLSPQVRRLLVDLLSIKGSANSMLSDIGARLASSEVGYKAAVELQRILSFLPDETLSHVVVDLSLARGADYYTGFILEGVMPRAPVGALLGGGRYDNLVADMGGESAPAAGMAFGLDRILTAMELLGINQVPPQPQTVFVAAQKCSGDEYRAFRIAQSLRSRGICASLSYEMESPNEACVYARQNGYAAAVIFHDHALTIEAIDEDPALYQVITTCTQS